MAKAVEKFVGIDVSKSWLDVAVHESGEANRVENDNLGIARLVAWLKERKPTRIVLEPTGGFEMRLVAELSHAGLPAVIWVLDDYPLRGVICWIRFTSSCR